jgi:hypothetical protein
MTNSYGISVFKTEGKAELDIIRAGYGRPKLSVTLAE